MKPVIKQAGAFALGIALAAGIGLVAYASPIAGASVNVLSLIPGTAANRLGKAEDAAHSSGDTGVASLFVVETTNGGTSSTDGDYAMPTLNSLGSQRVSLTPQSQEGWSAYRNLDIDETTGTTTQQLKGSAGVLHTCQITNDTASTKLYVKFYDATALTGSAAGTETPVMTFPIAGASTFSTGPIDYYFANGMTIAATTALADNDTGAPATSAIQVNCTYK